MVVIDVVDVWHNFLSGTVVQLERAVAGSRVLEVEDLVLHFHALAAGKNPFPLTEANDYVAVTTIGTVGAATTCLTLLALAGSTTFAVIRGHTKGDLALLQDVGFILGLMLVNVPQFMIADDIPFRTARFLFVPYGLCLSCSSS